MVTLLECVWLIQSLWKYQWPAYDNWPVPSWPMVREVWPYHDHDMTQVWPTCWQHGKTIEKYAGICFYQAHAAAYLNSNLCVRETLNIQDLSKSFLKRSVVNNIIRGSSSFTKSQHFGSHQSLTSIWVKSLPGPSPLTQIISFRTRSFSCETIIFFDSLVIQTLSSHSTIIMEWAVEHRNFLSWIQSSLDEGLL